MAKFKCTLEPDEEHIKRFNLTFECDDEGEAEINAMVEVKQNASDYFTINVEEITP